MYLLLNDLHDIKNIKYDKTNRKKIMLLGDIQLTLLLLPGCTRQSCQDEPFLVVGHFCDSGCLHLLPDPVALLQGVDEHELDTDVTAVGGLEPL